MRCVGAAAFERWAVVAVLGVPLLIPLCALPALSMSSSHLLPSSPPASYHELQTPILSYVPPLYRTVSTLTRSRLTATSARAAMDAFDIDRLQTTLAVYEAGLKTSSAPRHILRWKRRGAVGGLAKAFEHAVVFSIGLKC